MDWRPLAEMFPKIPIGTIKQVTMDCSHMDQCVDILSDLMNPLKDLEKMFPFVDKPTIEALYYKHKDKNRVASILLNEQQTLKKDTVNVWNKSLSTIKSQPVNKIKEKPPDRKVITKYKVVLQENVIKLFYSDKLIEKSSKGYQYDIDRLLSLKQEFITKSRSAYSDRRSHKFSGQGASIAGFYSSDVRDLETQLSTIRLQHAYALLREQQTDPFTYDFHSLQVKESKLILNAIIEFYHTHSILINGNAVHPTIRIITGKGNNTYEGYSKLNTCIKKVLKDNCIAFDNDSSKGTLRIRFNKN